MYLFELQLKEVINLFDGKRLGTIVDLEIEPSTGKITKIIVKKRRTVKSMIEKETNEYIIPWQKIVHIGKDVLFVRINILS